MTERQIPSNNEATTDSKFCEEWEVSASDAYLQFCDWLLTDLMSLEDRFRSFHTPISVARALRH